MWVGRSKCAQSLLNILHVEKGYSFTCAAVKHGFFYFFKWNSFIMVLLMIGDFYLKHNAFVGYAFRANTEHNTDSA